MADLTLAPLRTTDAHAYWQVYLDGRGDVPTRDLKVHLDRFLSLPPEEQRSHLAVLEQGRIVGTVRLLPATITGFAMARGHEDRARPAILKAMDLLRAQGATSLAASYEDRYAPAFEALGFVPWFSRMRMTAATRRHPLRPDLTLKPPEESEIVRLTTFFQAVYDGHLEQGFGLHVGGEEEWRAFVAGILKGEEGRFMPEASFVVADADRIHGAVLLTHWMGQPLVAELGVATDRRGKGLGRALMEAASTRLAGLGETQWALYVTVGNDPAIRLYESLGFAQAGGRTVTARLGPT